MGNKKSIVGQNWEETVSLAIDISVPFQTLVKNEEIFQYLLLPQNTSSDKAELTIKHLKSIIGNDVRIVEASRYKVPLSQKQLTALIFYHEYVVVKTQSGGKNYFWAFEKNSKNIRITLAQNLNRVVDFGYGVSQGSIEKRLQGKYWTPIKMSQKKANFDLYELIRWAYLTQIQKDKYHLLISNCKCFSRKVFEIVTSQQKK